jgi:2-methylcitrate dehydratase
MSFQRDLAWEYLNQVNRSSVSRHLARYALALDYQALPAAAVHQAKRSLLDALGCAIGAYQAPGRIMCENVAKQLGGPQESTVFGSGLRTSASNATLVNCFLVRFLDFNDLGGGGHNSDAIPAILAAGEKQKSNGQEVRGNAGIHHLLLRLTDVGRKRHSGQQLSGAFPRLQRFGGRRP